MDRSRHSTTMYMNDKKHMQRPTESFQQIGTYQHQLYEVQLAKSEIEHDESIVVDFFIRQYATLRMFELF